MRGEDYREVMDINGEELVTGWKLKRRRFPNQFYDFKF